MSYFSREGSAQAGSPVYRFLFSTGYDEYRYTTELNFVSDGTHTYEPAAISMGDVSQSGDMGKDVLSLDLPIDNALASLFRGYSPDHIVSVTVFRGHPEDGEFVVYWRGRVASHALDGKSVELKCESIFTSMRRPGLRARYQRACRHALYSAGCGIDKADYAVSGTISSVDQITLTIAEAATEDYAWFSGGVVEFPDGTFQMVTAHDGDQVVISRKCRYLDENATPISVTLYPGCDRTLTTCKVKFDNILNNGGFRWIPQKNPMGGTSII